MYFITSYYKRIRINTLCLRRFIGSDNFCCAVNSKTKRVYYFVQWFYFLGWLYVELSSSYIELGTLDCGANIRFRHHRGYSNKEGKL